jgi:hypothetical protein
MRDFFIQLDIKLFKLKKYFSDKKSSIMAILKRFLVSPFLQSIRTSLNKLSGTIAANFKENAYNWENRVAADKNFIINN